MSRQLCFGSASGMVRRLGSCLLHRHYIMKGLSNASRCINVMRDDVETELRPR